MTNIKDEPGVFFIARDLDQAFMGLDICFSKNSVDGPHFCKLAAIQAAEEFQDHGTYRIYRGEAVHVVTVSKPAVSSAPVDNVTVTVKLAVEGTISAVMLPACTINSKHLSL